VLNSIGSYQRQSSPIPSPGSLWLFTPSFCVACKALWTFRVCFVRCHRVSYFCCPEHILCAIWCRMTKLGVVVHHGMVQCYALEDK